jgi:hypothetical protein
MSIRMFVAMLASTIAVAGVRADDVMGSARTNKVELPMELKEGFRSLLSDQAIQVVDNQGVAWATFWFRKAIPSKAAPEQVANGLTYRELEQTTLIGVVQFAQPWTDFRKQKIAAGVYTLRIAIQPGDGDHQGTAPYTDFCLLIPVAKDEKPDAMEIKDLHELSKNAPGGNHPGVMLLFPNDKPEDQPKLAAKPNDITVLNVKLPIQANGKTASLGFAFVVVGKTTAQ